MQKPLRWSIIHKKFPKTIDRPFFKTIDPTSLNRQGNDKGSQYRTGIYYTDKVDLPTIRTAIDELAKEYSKPIVIEVKPLSNFYKAEEYHQDYLDKNPGGYCHINPALFELAKKQMHRLSSPRQITKSRMTPHFVVN